PRSPSFPYTTLFRSERETLLGSTWSSFPVLGKRIASRSGGRGTRLAVHRGDDKRRPFQHRTNSVPNAFFFAGTTGMNAFGTELRSEEHTSELQSPDH